MKLYVLTIALLCATSAAFAQNEETTTVAPTTQSPERNEISTEIPTTLAPETKPEEGTEKPEVTTQETPKESEMKNEGPMNFGGRIGGMFFPNQQDSRSIMFIPQTVRDPVTGMIYNRRFPLFGHPPQNVRPPIQPIQPSFDPLGSFTEHQKKRQFFQDLLMTQLSRFEKEVDPMMENETEEEGKAALISILQAVNNLKKALESNQIFNISEIMKTWKEGKLPGQTAPPTETGPAIQSQGQAPEAAPTSSVQIQPEQTPAEVVAVAEANPAVRAILLLPQRQRESTFLLQREPHQPLYIRRFAIQSQEEQALPPRDYPQQDHGYIAGY